MLKNFLVNTLPTRLPENYEISQPILPLLQLEIEGRVLKANSVINEFYEAQDAIEEEGKGEDDVEELKNREEFENEFFAVMAHAQEILTRGQAREPVNQNIQSQHNDTGMISRFQASVVSPKPLGVKLPTIALPKFNGEFESWLGFRDTFKSLIHDNRSIGDVQKFHYLKASVVGEAEEVIGSIELSDTNYAIT